MISQDSIIEEPLTDVIANRLVLRYDRCKAIYLGNIHADIRNRDKVEKYVNELFGRESTDSMNDKQYNAIMDLFLNLNPLNNNFEPDLDLKIANILYLPSFNNDSRHFGLKGFNPFSKFKNINPFAFFSRSSDTGHSSHSSHSSSKWWNPISWGKSSGSSTTHATSSSRSSNTFRGKGSTIPAGRLPSAVWPKNEEQYGVILPENNYSQVPAPEGYYVAPAFVVIQTFLSRNYALTIMCILLFVATALLIAGIYLNIRDHNEKEQAIKDRKLNVFKVASGVVQKDDIRNHKPATFHEVQPHALNYSMFVDKYPPKIPT